MYLRLMQAFGFGLSLIICSATAIYFFHQFSLLRASILMVLIVILYFILVMLWRDN